MDERKAIEQLKQRNIKGLETLVHTYQVQAVRSAYLVTRDRDLAEDIVQAAFLRSYERIDQFDADRPFGPWFLRIVVNDAIKAAARRKRFVPLEGEAGKESVSLTDLLADPNPGPADLAEAEETRQAIWTALGRLPPEQRGTIVLRYYLGCAALLSGLGRSRDGQKVVLSTGHGQMALARGAKASANAAALFAPKVGILGMRHDGWILLSPFASQHESRR